MGGESISSRTENILDMPTGTEAELLRISGAQLYLLDGEESVRMGIGDFALIMIVQAKTRLATLVAQVAEFQWPIGKDGPVLKIANLRYTFAIPGLLYGLILPDSTSQELVQRFESSLRQYCTFEIRPEIAKAAGVSDLRLFSGDLSVDGTSDGASYWTAVAEDVEGYSAKLVKQIKSGSAVAANSILKGGEWATWGIKRGGLYVKRNTANGEAVSPRMQKRVDQARRMSAVAKLLSRTVLKGAISATGHVANFLGTAISGAPPVRAFMSSDSRREVAVASVDAFAKVVEAVETAGKSLAIVTSTVGTDIVQHRFGEQAGQVAQDGMGAMGNMIDSMWTLNKVGLNMLWRATAATALNSANRSTSRSTSASSDTSMQSASQMNTSPGYSPTSTTSRQPSIGPTISLSPPVSQDEVLQTAQLFPPSPPVGRSQSQIYAMPPPNSYMHPQSNMPMPTVYAAYYHTPPHHPNPNSPFQQYTRPGVPPQVQPFFPYMDLSKSQ